MRWEVQAVTLRDEKSFAYLEELLAAGWEPFAATEGDSTGVWTYHLRIQKPVV